MKYKSEEVGTAGFATIQLNTQTGKWDNECIQLCKSLFNNAGFYKINLPSLLL